MELEGKEPLGDLILLCAMKRYLWGHNQTIDMAETSVTVDDPEVVTKKNVDSSGRLYLGRDFADKRVRLVVEVLEETPEEGDE